MCDPFRDRGPSPEELALLHATMGLADDELRAYDALERKPQVLVHIAEEFLE